MTSDAAGTATTHAPQCPVCRAECRGAPLVIYSTQRAALHFCPPWRDADRHERFLRCLADLWRTGETKIYRCPSCGFGFGYPFIGGNETFYRILHEQMGYPPWRWDYEVALGHPSIAKLSRGRALDIGAGSGVFLEHLGATWEKHAVESSALTRGVLVGKGIPAHESLDAPTLRELDGTFTLITLFQVLEHVSEFYPLLSRCHQLLAPGGVLFVTVPDADAMAAQEHMTGCPDMPPNHICRWSPSSLAFALRQEEFVPGMPIMEPPAWSKVLQNMYLTLLADAAEPGSLAAKIYRVRRKTIRAPLLRVAGVLALLRLLRFGSKLRHGGAFALGATKAS